MRRTASYLAMAGFAALIAFPSAAQADNRRERAYQPSAMVMPIQRIAPARINDGAVQMAAVNVSPSQAKSIALSHVRGSEFLDIKLVGGNTYVVRVIKNGRRIDVRIDANTGRVKS